MARETPVFFSVYFPPSDASWDHGLFKDEDDPGTLAKRKDTIVPLKQWSRWLILGDDDERLMSWQTLPMLHKK